jgi:hypothetical protein
MVDLFLSRLQVAIADHARQVGDFAHAHLDTETAQRAQLASMNFTDVGEETLDLLKSEDAGGLLAAFWSHYKVSLPESPARVLVNPPANLKVEGNNMTLALQPWLTGQYGRVLEGAPQPIDFVNFTSTFHGYFDDAVVFWDLGLDAHALASHLMPGGTITLIRPRPTKHGFWMAWKGLDLSFKTITDGVQSRFRLRNLTQGNAENFESNTFGLESK